MEILSITCKLRKKFVVSPYYVTSCDVIWSFGVDSEGHQAAFPVYWPNWKAPLIMPVKERKELWDVTAVLQLSSFLGANTPLMSCVMSVRSFLRLTVRLRMNHCGSHWTNMRKIRYWVLLLRICVDKIQGTVHEDTSALRYWGLLRICVDKIQGTVHEDTSAFYTSRRH